MPREVKAVGAEPLFIEFSASFTVGATAFMFLSPTLHTMICPRHLNHPLSLLDILLLIIQDAKVKYFVRESKKARSVP